MKESSPIADRYLHLMQEIRSTQSLGPISGMESVSINKTAAR